MSKGWTFRSGDWNAICDSCGKKLKASQLRLRWDGLMVCKDDFEQRHPQDFIRARQDKISVPWSRPISDYFPPVNEYIQDTTNLSETVNTSSGYYRFVGTGLIGGLDEDVVNGAILNFSELNHTSTDVAPPVTPEEQFIFSENIFTSSGYNVSISDTLTLSETIIEGEGEVLSDSVLFSETVFATIVTNKVLNAHLANGVTLG